MLKKDLKDKWVDALESGKYKQGFGFLRRKSGSYCSLGVLLDLAYPFLWYNDGEDYNPAFQLATAEGLLEPDDSELILENLGLPLPEQRQIVHFNDAGSSFKAIAQYIRENL